MPEPFEKPAPPEYDSLVSTLEKGTRARSCFQLGVDADLDRRRNAVYTVAENELRAGLLTPERAFMHVSCANALRRYKEELQEDIDKAERAAAVLHAEPEAETPDADV